MGKITVNKLRLTWWQELLYLLFVMVVPIVISACEIFSSHDTVFKITFSSIGSVLLTVILVRKFVFKSKIEKLQAKCLMNEHDYEIDVGDKDKLRKTWAIYNMLILIYHAAVLILSIILAWLFISALADQVIQFKGAATIILCSVFVGVIVKLVIFASMTRYTKETSNGDKIGS